MKVRYDRETDAIYIKLGEGKYLESEEIEKGVVVDYSKDGKVIGIEILNISSRREDMQELKKVFVEQK